MSLKRQAQSGIKWTTSSTIIVTVLQILQTSILARFLDPFDFGLMALVAVVLGFTGVFLDLGISAAIIHKQEITHNQLSTLYWVNVLMGLLLFGFVSAASPWIAGFYHQPELLNIIPLIAFTFVINSFGQQFLVLLEKELKFKIIAKISVINKALSLLVIVWFAYNDYGVYALVYGALIGAFINTIQLMTIGLKDHKPALAFKIGEIKGFLNFGMYQIGERTINYFNFQFDTILIGRLLGVEVLGIYTIAKELIMKPASIFNPVITKVTFPIMAKVQNDIPRLKNIYLKTINYLASINFPVYVFIAVLAPEIVLILFGDKYVNAVPIIQVLSIFGALRSTGNPIGSLLLARGRVKLGFYWNLGMFFYTPLSIYFYIQWGVLGISWGLVSNIFIGQLLGYYVLVKPLCEARLKEYFWQIIKPSLIAVIILTISYYFSGLFVDTILRLLSVSVIIGILFLVLNWFFNKEFLQEILELFKK